MTRSQQREALISHLQAIDTMCAMILVLEPSVLGREHGSVQFSETVTWEVETRARVFHTITLFRAVRAAGATFMRALINMLGIEASSDLRGNTPKLKSARVRDATRPLSSQDLRWEDIPGSLGLTPWAVKTFSAHGIYVTDVNGDPRDVHDVLLQVLKVIDKEFVHLTHDGDWSDALYGDILGAAVFTIVAVQELVLLPSWGDRFDELVFSNSHLFLPHDLLEEQLDTVDDFRQAVIEVLSKCARQGLDYDIPLGIGTVLDTRRFEIKQDLHGDGAKLYVFEGDARIEELPLRSVGSCVQHAHHAYGIGIDAWVQQDQ